MLVNVPCLACKMIFTLKDDRSWAISIKKGNKLSAFVGFTAKTSKNLSHNVTIHHISSISFRINADKNHVINAVEQVIGTTVSDPIHSIGVFAIHCERAHKTRLLTKKKENEHRDNNKRKAPSIAQNEFLPGQSREIP